MSYQEKTDDSQEENVVLLANGATVKTKPKLDNDCNETDDDYYIEINLPGASAIVLNGSGNQWTLSQLNTTSAIQELVVLDGNVQTQSFNETELNMAAFSSPKRVEIYTSSDSSATPYVIFQEVVSRGVQGWQIYAPVPFIITSTSGGKNSWTTAVSSEDVSIEQVKVYENCDYNVQQPPPPESVALFDMTSQEIIGEIDIQS